MSTATKLPCDGQTTSRPSPLRSTAASTVSWLRRLASRTRASQGSFTVSPAIAARWAWMFAPSGFDGTAVSRPSSSGAATTAPSRSPASPSHLENE